jgi:hypothetical protein
LIGWGVPPPVNALGSYVIAIPSDWSAGDLFRSDGENDLSLLVIGMLPEEVSVGKLRLLTLVFTYGPINAGGVQFWNLLYKRAGSIHINFIVR